MNTIEQALLAYYKLSEARKQKYAKYYPNFYVFNTILGFTLIGKN